MAEHLHSSLDAAHVVVVATDEESMIAGDCRGTLASTANKVRGLSRSAPVRH